MPRETRKILCAVNLRHLKLEQNAYEEACEMAARRGAELIVATVAPEMERNLNIRDSEAYWQEELKKFVRANPPGPVKPRLVVRKGAVHRAIVKLAIDEKVDLIVMEAANPKIQDYLLGTTASHVAAHAPCSVYLVRTP